MNIRVMDALGFTIHLENNNNIVVIGTYLRPQQKRNRKEDESNDLDCEAERINAMHKLNDEIDKIPDLGSANAVFKIGDYNCSRFETETISDKTKITKYLPTGIEKEFQRHDHEGELKQVNPIKNPVNNILEFAFIPRKFPCDANISVTPLVEPVHFHHPIEIAVHNFPKSFLSSHLIQNSRFRVVL